MYFANGPNLKTCPLKAPPASSYCPYPPPWVSDKHQPDSSSTDCLCLFRDFLWLESYGTCSSTWQHTCETHPQCCVWLQTAFSPIFRIPVYGQIAIDWLILPLKGMLLLSFQFSAWQAGSYVSWSKGSLISRDGSLVSILHYFFLYYKECTRLYKSYCTCYNFFVLFIQQLKCATRQQLYSGTNDSELRESCDLTLYQQTIFW